MRARDLMTTPAVVTHSDTPVKTAESMLAERGFTALPVVDEDDRLAGIVTEADFVADRFPGPLRRAARTVRELMSVPVRTVDVDDDAAALAKVMLTEHIRCLPVLDRGKLAGVVTRRDFLRALARPDRMLAHDVRQRLNAFGGSGRWTVDVREGDVTVLDRFDNERDRQVAVALAESVPGVIRVHCYVGEIEYQEERS